MPRDMLDAVDVVDAHHHFWDINHLDYPWLRPAQARHFFLGDCSSLYRNFRPSDLCRQARATGIRLIASVHVEAECTRQQALDETRWLHAQHAAHGLPTAVVAWVDLLHADAEEHLARQAAFARVRGVRCKPVTGRHPDDKPQGAGSLRDKSWPRALALLHECGLRWDLRVPYWHLHEAAAMLEDAPPVAVVLEHCGLPWDRSKEGLAAWRAGMQALAVLPNVHVKLSEFGLQNAPWNTAENARIAREAIAIFGWRRALFGSNFPVSGLRAAYADVLAVVQHAMQQAGLDAAQQKAVWHDNAVAFYALERVGHE